jgi:O-glycosyl hydrolase
MGASDYTISPEPYTYDDLPVGQTDPTLTHFAIAHDEAYIIPALREVLAINRSVFTLANPWTPPAWMKANEAFDNIGLSGAVLPQYYPALAEYFVKFIQDYQARGVPINALTPMNEPRANVAWPGAALTPGDDATFVPQYLTPALDAAGVHPIVFGLDDTELSDAQALLSGPAGPDLGGIAFHCYDGLGQMSTLHAEYPSERIIVNECSPGISPYPTGEVGIDATANWASAVQLWNLALDPARRPYETVITNGACTALVTVDETTHQARMNLNYYQYGQISKFVHRGAIRIYSTRLVTDGQGISVGLDDVAFENPDGSKVLVAYNNEHRAAHFAIDWHGRYLNYRLPPQATVTFKWR